MDIYEYDLEADAFVLSREKYNYTYSIEVTSELIVDIDSNKNLVAIELLDASKVPWTYTSTVLFKINK